MGLTFIPYFLLNRQIFISVEEFEKIVSEIDKTRKDHLRVRISFHSDHIRSAKNVFRSFVFDTTGKNDREK